MPKGFTGKPREDAPEMQGKNYITTDGLLRVADQLLATQSSKPHAVRSL
jgi:hypothetical protein